MLQRAGIKTAAAECAGIVGMPFVAHTTVGVKHHHKTFGAARLGEHIGRQHKLTGERGG